MDCHRHQDLRPVFRADILLHYMVTDIDSVSDPSTGLEATSSSILHTALGWKRQRQPQTDMTEKTIRSLHVSIPFSFYANTLML